MEAQPQMEDKFKYCFIMRGLPGSGKSTVARKIAGPNGVIHSTDTFIEPKSGETAFTKAKVVELHDKNFTEFQKSVESDVAMIVVDHTNVCEWEFEKYSEYAKSHNYIVSVVTLPDVTEEDAASRSSHSVSKSKIRGMMDIWEPIKLNNLKQKSLEIKKENSKSIQEEKSE